MASACSFGATTKYWLPAIFRSTAQIDHLFNFILGLTGVVFAATEVALFWFLWALRRPAIAAVKYTHGSHNLEVVWTILPAATLLFIAIYQMNAWADVKMACTQRHASHVGGHGPAVRMAAALPGPRRQAGHVRRHHHVNDMHIPFDEEVLLDLKSMDVLHDFFTASANQARRRARHDHTSLVSGQGCGHLRPGMRRVVRLGALQDEGPANRRKPQRFGCLAEAEIRTKSRRRKTSSLPAEKQGNSE